jgi:hypothetical protein
VKEASGKTERVHFRLACPKFLRQTFHEFATHSIRQSEWARAYYEHLRDDGKKSHHGDDGVLYSALAYESILTGSRHPADLPVLGGCFGRITLALYRK